jgi:hypothetical protein
MNDGHSGIENRQVNQGGSGNFQLVLAYLKQGTGRGDFVIHATSSTFYSYGLQPLEFLAEIGFIHYQGQCTFHDDKCFYRAIAELQPDIYGHENFIQVQRVHDAFLRFAGKIGELFQLRQQEDRILEEIGIQSAGRVIFGQPLEIQISEKDIPLWVDEVKFPRLLKLEIQKDAIQKDIGDLGGYLPLLYGTGDVLEEAVIKALRVLGLDVQRARRGFTADILAQTSDGSRKFGIEVTGVSGAIKKESKKLTQLLEFERIKQHGEKTVLIANTFNATPIGERKKEQDFTPQVLEFLGPHPILLMTSWGLYCMVRAALENPNTREKIIDALHTTVGRLNWNESA